MVVAPSRRPPGTGSLYQSPSSGYWFAAILIDGRVVRRRRDTEAEARDALDALLVIYADQLGWQYIKYTRNRYEAWVARGTRPARAPRSGVTPSVRWRVLERDGHRCVYCGSTTENGRLVVDHVRPIADGGTDDFDNLATACELCNLGKGDRALLTPLPDRAAQ